MTKHDTMRWQKTQIPASWPKWKRQCSATSWRSGEQCRLNSVLGSGRCKRHGGGGEITALVAWKRYLLWVLLPDTIRTTSVQSPITEQEVEVLCNVLAQYVVTGDAWASDAVRMRAIEYLFDSVAVAAHADPALLLTHLKRDDADVAVKILRDNGLLK